MNPALSPTELPRQTRGAGYSDPRPVFQGHFALTAERAVLGAIGAAQRFPPLFVTLFITLARRLVIVFARLRLRRDNAGDRPVFRQSAN